MIHYKSFNFKSILDRPDLVYCPYVAALDIQYAHNLPYLWTFYFDSTDETIYGRTFEDLIDFLEIMKTAMRFSSGKNKHYLVIIVDDLFTFFGNTKKVLPYVSEPFVAKSGSDVLLATLLEVYQIHSYKAYFESDAAEDMFNDYGIVTPEINTDELSALCELTQDEIDRSENKVRYIANVFRGELDLKYQGVVSNLPLTKTSRVNHLFYIEERKMSNRANCNLASQVMKLNPLTSEYGREYILPLLFKSFFGGAVWFEKGVPDVAFDDVWSVDATSAYVARMVLSRYPVGKFKDLPRPGSYTDIYKDPYKRYAMLITFRARNVKLKADGLPFLPSALRNHYVNVESHDELDAQIERSGNVRVIDNKYLHMTLTDVDFKLFIENYEAEITIDNIVGSLYGYLPDYIIQVILRLYSNKAEAKERKLELEALGLLTSSSEIEYERIKSELARLYGIFTKRPVMERYIFDMQKKEPVVIDHEYIQPTAKYKPVVYQWGVWTTALVRKEISDLRRRLLGASSQDRRIKVLSGDTDNINYTGDAMDIIAEYNEKIKSQIEARSKALNISPELLKDLGSLTVKKYRKYKLTGLKQYCFIQDTEQGPQFKYKVGGMNADCKYFDKHFKTPEQRFNHFSLGLTIPAEEEPRVCMIPVNVNERECWTDREGNLCEGEVLSYVKKTLCKFTLYPATEPTALGNGIKPGQKITVDELNYFARKVANPVYNPSYYINNKKRGRVK